MTEATHHNPMWIMETAMVRSQDTINPQKAEDEWTAVSLTEAEAEIYQAEYKACTYTNGVPNDDGGPLSYDGDLLQWLNAKLASDDKGDKGSISKDEADIAKAQSQFQSDNSFATALEGRVDAAAKQETGTVKADDSDITQMTQECSLMGKFSSYTERLLAQKG